MSVVFVVDGAIEQTTGGYLYDRIVVDGLRARGHEIKVFSLDVDTSNIARESLRLAALVTGAERTDTLVVDELCHPRALLAALAHRARGRRGPRLVALVHHLAASERRGLRARGRLALERALLDAADGVIATSETTRGVLERAGVGRAKIAVARPGRDRLGEHLVARAPRASCRFLFVGGVAKRKGVLGLVRAFAEAPRDATLTIVGGLDREPAYAREVLALAERDPRVTLLGEAPDAALRDLFLAHEVLVLPSFYEGYGIVLAEALAHGLGVVATRVGAIPEVVRDGHEAELVPPGDVAALARTLARVATSGELRARLQRSAIERAGELSTWRDTVLDVERALRLRAPP